MVRVIITVLVLLLVLAYAALFLSWNLTPVTVIGVSWGGQDWVEDVPLGVLILGGVLAGAILMAAFSLGAYHAQRVRAADAEALVAQAKQKLGMAKEKVDELVAKVKQQRDKIGQLEKGATVKEPPAGLAERAQETGKPESVSHDEEEI